MPKLQYPYGQYQFVNEITRPSTMVGMYGPFPIPTKVIGDIAFAHATITNTGNMNLTVDITVQHYEVATKTMRPERIGINGVTIAPGASYTFDEPTGQAITSDWINGNYGTTIRVYNAGTANLVPGGQLSLDSTFVVATVYQVSITNITVT